MRGKTAGAQKLLRFISAAVLVAGLGSALWVYQAADEASDDVLMYEFRHSKKYRHDREAYGGKMTVVASDFVRWCEELLQGKSLAVLIGGVSVAVSSVLFFVAYRLPRNGKGDHREDRRE